MEGNMYEKVITVFVCFIVSVFIAWAVSGCKSVADTGIESLVESRIIAERDRIRGEFAAELGRWIAEDIRLAAKRVDAITDGQAAVRATVGEYRRFCLELIERLQRVEDQGRNQGQVADVGNDSGGNNAADENR
jgi:hypothetical protein